VTILRQRRSGPARTDVPNPTLEDRRLTYRARGVLGNMLAKPDGWDFSADRLARESTPAAFPDGHKPASEGRDTIRTCLVELRRAGYLRLVRRQLSAADVAAMRAAGEDAPRGGSWRTEYEVSDLPVAEWADHWRDAGGDVELVALPGGDVGMTGPADANAQVGPETGLPGFGRPDVGPPDVGRPDVGRPGAKDLPTSRDVPTGLLTESRGTSVTHSSPNPTADAAGGSRCAKHPNGHPNCRGCGTTARQRQAMVDALEAETRRAAERDRTAGVLAAMPAPAPADSPGRLAARAALEARRRQ
jgi:hypothetical protein